MGTPVSPAQVLWDALTVIKLTMQQQGASVNDDDFRILNATIPTKISFHISNIKHVFRYNTHQKWFWEKVVKNSNKYETLWVNKQSVFDNVYGKKRAMRTVFSGKPGKNNQLKPMEICKVNNVLMVRTVSNPNLADYLLTDFNSDGYSVLNKRKEIIVFKKSLHQRNIKPAPELISTFIKSKKYLSMFQLELAGTTLRLVRIRRGYCKI